MLVNMPAKSQVHIAGAGISLSRSGGSQEKALVSAATKALLDAGVTYNDVTRGVRDGSLNGGDKAFEAFNDAKVSVDKVKGGSELQDAAKLVTEKGEKCVLVIATDEVRNLRASERVADKCVGFCCGSDFGLGRFRREMAVSKGLIGVAQQYRRERQRWTQASLSSR
jgi:hypothetical protein